MTRMLVLSDKLHFQKDAIKLTDNVDVYQWIKFPNIPRLSDYEVVVLDMSISTSNKYSGTFLGIKEEVKLLLKSGGVLICLNHFTRITTRITSLEDNYPARAFARPGYRYEINYDWVPDISFLSATNVA